MKKLFTILLMGLLATTLSAQDYDWGMAFGTALNSSSANTTVDHLTRNPNNGWIYAAGTFKERIEISAITQQIVATSTFALPSYVAAIDSLGNAQWFGKFEGSGDIKIYGIHFSNNRVWVVGDFSGTINFNINGSGSPQNLSAVATRAGFITAYNATNGNFIFAQKLDAPTSSSGINLCRVEAITSSSPTSLVVHFTGYFSGTINFNPLGTANNQTSSVDNAFLMSYNSLNNSFGNFKRWGSNSSKAWGKAIAYTSNDYVVVGGNFENTVDFDPDAGVVNRTSKGGRDIFVTYFTNSHGFNNNFVAGGTGADELYTLSASGNSVYAGGSYSSRFIYFNKTTGNDDTLQHVNGTEGFLLRASTVGFGPANPAWAIGIKGQGNQAVNSVTADPDGNAYISLFFNGSVSGPEVGNVTLNASSTTDGLIAKYNANGVNQFAHRIHSPVPDESRAIRAHGNNRFYVGGVFANKLHPDPANPTQGFFSSPTMNQNGYVLKYGTAPCVAPAQPGPIIAPDTVCAGDTVYVSVQPVQGATHYEWTSTSGWTFINIPNTPVNGKHFIANSTSGQLSVRAFNGTCPSQPSTKNITALSPPGQPGTITANKPTCLGDTVTFSITAVTGATSYQWAVPVGWTLVSTASNGLSCNAIVGNTSGSVVVRARNYCGDKLSFLSVTPLQVPAMPDSIQGPSQVCVGDTVQYSIVPTPGATSYVWVAPSNWTVIGSSNTNTIKYKTANNIFGVAIVSVRAVNQCGQSQERTKSVIINTPPPTNIGPIQGSTSVCTGTAQTYSVSNPNSSYTYTWTASSGTISGNGNSSITVTWSSPNTAILFVTASNQCGTSNASTLNVTINSGTPPAQPSPIMGSTTVCLNTSQTYSVTNDPNVTYQWQVLGNAGTVSGSGNSVSITFTRTGTQTISCTPVGTCGAGPARTLDVLVHAIPATPDTIFGPKTVCPGQNVTYSITPVSGATTYTWLGPNTNGWSFTPSNTTSFSVTTGTSAATIQVTASNSCGVSGVKTLSVTQGNPPVQPQPISGPSEFCAGDTVTFSVVHPINGTVSSYNWTLGGATVISNPSPGHVITVVYPGNTTSQISVTALNGCGSSQPRTKAITINTPPSTPGVISGPDTVCSNTQNIPYSIAAVSGASSYVWSLPANWLGSSNTTTMLATCTSSGSSGTITVRALNQCGSSSTSVKQVVVTNEPPQPGLIQGDTVVCPGQTKIYNVPPVNGATSYVWILPSGWSGSSTTNSITTTAGTNGGVISVYAKNSCGEGLSRNLVINIGAAPQPVDTILGPDMVCVDIGQSYSVPQQVGVTYNWTVSGGGSTMTGGNTHSPTIVWTSSGTKTITITISNACGSVSKTKTITVNSGTAPAKPTGFTGDTLTCLKTDTYSVTQVSGITYQWTVSGNNLIQSNGNTASVTWTSTGQHIITCIPFGQCGAGTPLVQNVLVEMPNTTISNSGNTFSVPQQTGATYQWYDCVSNQPIPGATSNEYTFTASGEVYVKVSRFGCEENSACISVTITADIDATDIVGFTIYPNPVKEKLYVKQFGNNPYELQVIDLLGNKLIFQRMEAEVFGLDISGLAQGIYFVEILNEHQKTIYRKRFLKQ